MLLHVRTVEVSRTKRFFDWAIMSICVKTITGLAGCRHGTKEIISQRTQPLFCPVEDTRKSKALDSRQSLSMSMGWSQRTTTLNVRNVSFSDHDLLMRKAGIANGSCKFDSQQLERFFLRLDESCSGC